MKFTASRPPLATAIKTVAAAAGGSLPICSGVRIDAGLGEAGMGEVVVTCTNLDLTIRAAVEALDVEPGTTIVPATFLSRFLAATDGGTVSMSADGSRLHAESGEATITLSTLSESEWPNISYVTAEPVTFSPAQLHDLRKVVGYAYEGQKAPNPLLVGVNFAGRHAEASDLYRAARATLEVEVPTPVVVPAEALKGVLRNATGSVTFAATSTHASFASGNVEWMTVLLEGEFPRLDAVIRTEDAHRLTIGVERLAEAVRRVRILSEGDDSEAIILSVDGGKAILRNRATEHGEIVDVVPCDGSLPWPTTFRGKFLADLLDNADDEAITFGFASEVKPTQVTTERLLEVVMPVRSAVPKK